MLKFHPSFQTFHVIIFRKPPKYSSFPIHNQVKICQNNFMTDSQIAAKTGWDFEGCFLSCEKDNKA